MSHVAFSHDGSFLVTTSGADATILLWRCNYIKQLPTTSRHIDLIISKPLSPAPVQLALTREDTHAQSPSKRRSRRKHAEEEALGHVAPYLQNVSMQAHVGFARVPHSSQLQSYPWLGGQS
jgi:hypothetical protein